MNPKSLISAAALAACAALPAAAQEAGTITFGLGLHQVNPKSDNGTIAGMSASVGSSTRPTITAEYFIRDNLGVELLAALPFKHSVSLDGTRIGTVKQLPPVVSLQYHFANGSKVTPFVGLGVNFTTFFDEDSGLGDLKLKNSWGLAAHVGVDVALNEKAALRIDARWADIDSKVSLNGAGIGTAEIDPVVYGMSYVWRF
ncbi:MAG: OmpW family outer membrane protein [Paracoccaceae bacterium]